MPGTDTLYPPVGFYYSVCLASGNAKAEDSRFKEASGLTVELAVDEVAEGGENRFKHHVPTGSKYTNLVLKRGLVVSEMPFFKWCRETLQGTFANQIVPKYVKIVLFDEKQKPRKTWHVVNAYPVKWSVSDFDSMDGQIVIETLELVYQHFRIE